MQMLSRGYFTLAFLLLVTAACIWPGFLHAAETKISSSKSAIPKPTDEEAELMRQEPYSTGEIFWGAAAGYAVGFGTGHLIEGRWLKRGWYFTVVDAIGAGLLAQGTKSCGINDAGCDARRSGSVAGGMVIVGVSRLWQLIDTIGYAQRLNQGIRDLEKKYPDFEAGLIPTDQSVLAFASLSF